jgi:hypothetical protein
MSTQLKGRSTLTKQLKLSAKSGKSAKKPRSRKKVENKAHFTIAEIKAKCVKVQNKTLSRAQVLKELTGGLETLTITPDRTPPSTRYGKRVMNDLIDEFQVK